MSKTWREAHDAAHLELVEAEKLLNKAKNLLHTARRNFHDVDQAIAHLCYSQELVRDVEKVQEGAKAHLEEMIAARKVKA